jgi:hypothetical protein
VYIITVRTITSAVRLWRKEMDKRESNGLYEYSASSVDIPEWCHAGLVTDGYTVVTDENGVVTVSWA